MTNIIMSVKHLNEFLELEWNLLRVFWTLVNLWPDESLSVTSIGRSVTQDRALGASGIHSAGPPWRAIDISIRTLKGGQDAADGLADLVNDMWVYDPRRPTMGVCYAKPHGSGPHIHLQVHPRTRRKGQRVSLAPAQPQGETE
jgi:hypothetical protein